MLLLLFAPQPSLDEASSINFGTVLSELYAPLNARGDSDLVFWNRVELLGYIDEGIAKLARRTGAYVERNTELETAEDVGQYAVPARNLDVLQLDLDGRTIRARTIPELEARDATWTETEATDDRPVEAFALDVEGFEKLVLYPLPALTGEPINIVRSRLPERNDLQLADTPAVLRDYFTFWTIAKARAKESQGSMDEVVPWLQQILGMVESTAQDLWGL